MRNEFDRRREDQEVSERVKYQPSNPVQHMEISQLDMRQKDTGVNKGGERLQSAIYRITEQQSISPGELTRETEEDSELCHFRTLLLANQLDRLPEPYRSFKNTLSTKYGLIFQDEKLVVPAGSQTAMVNLLHKHHTGIDRMKQAAPT